MIVLGIETSCDDTSVAIVDVHCPAGKRILALVTYQQTEDHRAYQGVVPEIAARSHIHHLPTLIQEALHRAHITWSEITGIAATIGPGLIGGVLVGATMAKTMAMALNKPFVGVHHLEGHLLAARLVEDIPFPFLAVLASGGHTQLVLCHDLGQYTVLGRTLDDAVGECFDKAAKLLDLGYPGGPYVEQQAQLGRSGRFMLPRPLMSKSGCDFSFSGLKTAVKNHAHGLNPEEKADLAADFQEAVADVLENRLSHALEACGTSSLSHVVFTGGVSANQYLRHRLDTFLASRHLAFKAPPLSLCTDNGAMIAWAGVERLRRGWASPLTMEPRPRWPLEGLASCQEDFTITQQTQGVDHDS